MGIQPVRRRIDCDDMGVCPEPALADLLDLARLYPETLMRRLLEGAVRRPGQYRDRHRDGRDATLVRELRRGDGRKYRLRPIPRSRTRGGKRWRDESE